MGETGGAEGGDGGVEGVEGGVLAFEGGLGVFAGAGFQEVVLLRAVGGAGDFGGG